jgi:hypothetical protein
MKLSVSVILTCLVALTAGIVVPVTDPNLVFSAYNWDVGNQSAAASNPGASLKFGFTGSASVGLILDTSESTPTPCTIIVASVDDGPWTFFTPSPGSVNFSLILAVGLNPVSNHDVRVFLYASCEQSDRWLRRPAAAGGNSFVIVIGVTLDGGASTALPPYIHPNQALFYGDSITEGTNAANYDFDTGSCGGKLGLANSASTDSWAFAFAEAAAVEPSLAAFAAQVGVSMPRAIPRCLVQERNMPA